MATTFVDKFLAVTLQKTTLVGLLITAVVVTGYFYNQNLSSQAEIAKIKVNPQAAGTDDAKKLIDRVGKLVALPEGEAPTIATVTDIEKLRGQPFFAKARNGDKVLIYTQSKKAYLYDPELNKVLDIAPVNIGNQQSQVAGASTEEKPTPTKAPKKKSE